MSDDYVNDKEVNIQKFDQAQFSKEEAPFTMLPNSVIQNIADPFAFHIWAYLQSKPITWEPNRQELMNRFGLGDETLASILTFLKASNLVSTHQERLSNGRMGTYHIKVLNGSKFVKVDNLPGRRKPKMKIVDNSCSPVESGVLDDIMPCPDRPRLNAVPVLTAPPLHRPPAYPDYINKEDQKINKENTTTTFLPKETEDMRSISEICSSSTSLNLLVDKTKEAEEMVCNSSDIQLRKLDFNETEIADLKKLFEHNPEVLEESVNRFVYDLQVNKKIIRTNPQIFFTRIMETKKSYGAPVGYLKSQNSAEVPQGEHMELTRKKLWDENFHKEKAKWLASLTSSELGECGIKGCHPNDPRVDKAFQGGAWKTCYKALLSENNIR